MDNKPEIILVGGGKHCKAVIDVIEQENKFTIAGIVDFKERIGEKILNYPIIACDDDLTTLSQQFQHFCITLGQGKSNQSRVKTYNLLTQLKVNLPTIISPRAYVSKYSTIGNSNVIMHGAIINSATVIGNNNILNTFCLLEHDVEIGNHNHISTRTTLNGSVIIGSNCFIGSGSVIIDKLNIWSGVIIGANGLVINNISESGTYVGSPIKKLK